MRPESKPKLTKRQRKNAGGYNAMQKRSIKNGRDIVSRTGSRYRGDECIPYVRVG